MVVTTRWEEVATAQAAACKICKKPILLGPAFASESRANLHRMCLQNQVRQDVAGGKAQDLLLQAITFLCRSLPSAPTTIVPLAAEFNQRRTLRDYLEFLSRAITIVQLEPMRLDHKAILNKAVVGIRNQILHHLMTGQRQLKPHF